MIGGTFKKHCEALEKHINLPEITVLKDVVSKAVKWEDRNELEKPYFYLSVNQNNNLSEEERNIKATYHGYAVKVKPEYEKKFQSWRCDENDSINLEIVDWGKDGYLFIASNNVIISSHWLNLLRSIEGSGIKEV